MSSKKKDGLLESLVIAVGAVVAAVAVLGVFVIFEAPPPAVEQIGYRGLAMERVDNPERKAMVLAANEAPAPAPAASGGPKAGDIYQNVQVLGDLDVASFTRLMASITEWVSPEQGCAYCHQGANFATDDLYTKIVARRMIQMTQHVNTSYKTHVGATGVNCYTCHRGKNVPEYIWFKDPGPRQARGMASSRQGQNLASPSVAYASLPFDPMSRFFTSDSTIRVQATTALPTSRKTSIGTKNAEYNYGLMMHFSQSLGVNCTYCHNSRAFGQWAESPPTRVTAWHGIQMVRDLNVDYLEPLGPQYPPNRIGQTGDAPKAACSTCHQGLNKPLNGAPMVDAYPSLAGG